eukprot:SAG31_NODE_288_length_18400_cov_55.018851_19_plen_152_part_00
MGPDQFTTGEQPSTRSSDVVTADLGSVSRSGVGSREGKGPPPPPPGRPPLSLADRAPEGSSGRNTRGISSDSRGSSTGTLSRPVSRSSLRSGNTSDQERPKSRGSVVFGQTTFSDDRAPVKQVDEPPKASPSQTTTNDRSPYDSVPYVVEH